MARKKKWQYLDVKVSDLKRMSRKRLIEFAENNGHFVNKRIRTKVIRDALIDWLLDQQTDEIVDNYETFEEIENSTATIIPKQLPRKLDI